MEVSAAVLMSWVTSSGWATILHFRMLAQAVPPSARWNAGGNPASDAGLHASRLDGSRLTYNHADPYLPDFVICRPELADDVLSLVAPFVG